MAGLPQGSWARRARSATRGCWGNVEAPPSLEASSELTLLRDRERSQISGGGWTAGSGCHLLQPWDKHFWRQKGAKACPGFSSAPLASFPYKFFMTCTSVFQVYLNNQHCLCSLRAPFLRVLDVTLSGQKTVCYYATLLTFGCQNLELFWLLTTWNSSTEFSRTS